MGSACVAQQLRPAANWNFFNPPEQKLRLSRFTWEGGNLQRAQDHSIIEEEIFYPALEGKIDEDLLKEAYVEHDGAKVLINEIAAGGGD